MTSLEISNFSSSENAFLKSLLKNPEEDFEKIEKLLENKFNKTTYQLKALDERYRYFIENAIEGFWVIDENAKTVLVNSSMAKMLGYTTGEMIGRSLFIFMDEKSAELTKIHLEKRKKGISEERENIFIHKSGEKLHLGIRATPIFSEEGNYEGASAFLTDITKQKLAEEKLKESEEQFRTITEQSFLGIAILQNNFVEYINKQLADIVGYNAKEIMKWGAGGFMNVIHPEDRQIVAEQAKKKQIGESDVVDQYQFRGFKKNGDMIWLELFSKTINYRGELADFVMIRDITYKKLSEQKLKESEEKFRKITEESLLSICIIQDDVIKYVNREMAHLFGYSVEEMMSWKPGEMLKTVAPGSLEVVKEQLKRKQCGDPDVILHYPIECTHRNGESFWVDNLSKTIIYEGRPADLITQVDITERIKAQKELVKLNQLKSELLRRTSHELKTPLVSIKGFSELLLEVHRDKLDALVISTLNEIKQGCLRLETLIGDILKTAELESGIIKLIKAKEDLTFLVKVCVNEIKGFSRLRNHKISLKLHDSLITHFEKEQIHQVISNLLNNAVKYTPPGGFIEIKSKIQEDIIVLSITDSGIGFTKEEKNRIFKQFGKVERYGQGLDIIAEGSGFGLYISKKIIELHNGDIWVESGGRNKGSTFFVSLPII